MSESLYSLDVLRLAAAVADHPPLDDAPLRAGRRSPTCGSRMNVTLVLNEAGCVAAVGLDARACALGQAAATLFARGAIGRDRAAIGAASEAWRAYLAGEAQDLPDWPGLEVLAAGRAYPARHPSMRLAFEAAVAAFDESSDPSGDAA